MPAFSPEQDAALKAVADWMKAKPGRGRAPLIFRLFGYAGTGKTTLAKHIAEGVDGKVLFAAFTGKAAMVMRSKGCQGATTIHSLIYRPLESSTATPSFDIVGRRAGLEGEADRHRRMLDGRRRARARSEILRRAAAGARRSRATAADPGRRLLHRRRARRHAHRSAPAGAGRSDRAAVDGHPRRQPAAARHLRRDPGGDARRARPAARARRRPGAGRPQRDAARLQHAHARSAAASRASCRSPATSWSACATTGARACSTAGSG